MNKCKFRILDVHLFVKNNTKNPYKKKKKIVK